MSSYAVLWQVGDDRAVSGRLEFDAHGLWLHGGSRGHQVRLEIAYSEIVGAERGLGSVIGPCRALRLDCRDRGRLLLASVAGVGVLGEIQNTIRENLAV